MDYTFSETQLRQLIEMTSRIVLENATANINFTRLTSEISFDEALHLEGATGVNGLCHFVPMKMDVANRQELSQEE